jgi:DNA adenine methylase
MGNKRGIAHKIIPYFPAHTAYVELFFGAGGIFFNKSLAEYNFLNDLDGDIINLYDVIKLRKEELVHELTQMPIHQTLFNRWAREGVTESDDVMKSVRFIFLSNFSYLGKMDTMRLNCDNPKKMIFDRLDATQKMVENAYFTNCDFRQVLKKIAFRTENRKNVFVYADPPYLGTTDKAYQTGEKWKESDTKDLFELLMNSGFKFAISEFDNPLILDLAKLHNLNVVEIEERRNLKNRKTEILITNYG